MESPHNTCALCGQERQARLQANGREASMLAHIRTVGYHKIGVAAEGEESAFCYTAGLFHMHKHPEVIVFGLDTETGFGVLDTVAELVERGWVATRNAVSPDVLEDQNVRFVEFSEGAYNAYLRQACNFYGSVGFPVLMLLWPDREGRFPNQPNAPEWLRRLQPGLWVPEAS